MIWGEPILAFALGWLMVGFVARLGWRAADRSFEAIIGVAFNAYWWVRERMRS